MHNNERVRNTIIKYIVIVSHLVSSACCPFLFFIAFCFKNDFIEYIYVLYTFGFASQRAHIDMNVVL